MASPRPVHAFRDLEIGDIVTVRLPQHRPSGHEQEGHRPAVIVGVPDLAGAPRFDVVLLAPFTSDHNQPWAIKSPQLYPRLAAGTGNLRSDSICLLDQIRAVDKRRIARRRGRLDTQHFALVLSGLLTTIGQSTAD